MLPEVLWREIVAYLPDGGPQSWFPAARFDWRFLSLNPHPQAIPMACFGLVTLRGDWEYASSNRNDEMVEWLLRYCSWYIHTSAASSNPSFVAHLFELQEPFRELPSPLQVDYTVLCPSVGLAHPADKAATLRAREEVPPAAPGGLPVAGRDGALASLEPSDWQLLSRHCNSLAFLRMHKRRLHPPSLCGNPVAMPLLNELARLDKCERLRGEQGLPCTLCHPHQALDLGALSENPAATSWLLAHEQLVQVDRLVHNPNPRLFDLFERLAPGLSGAFCANPLLFQPLRKEVLEVVREL